VRDLHLATCDELGVEPAVKAEIVALLDNLQQLLIGICIMQVGLN
jgi:aspartate kinase